MALVDACKTSLETAQQKIQSLIEKDNELHAEAYEPGAR